MGNETSSLTSIGYDGDDMNDDNLHLYDVDFQRMEREMDSYDVDGTVERSPTRLGEVRRRRRFLVLFVEGGGFDESTKRIVLHFFYISFRSFEYIQTKIYESKNSVKELENKLRNIELENRTKEDRTFGTPDTQSSKSSGRFTPTSEYLTQIKETDDFEIKRLRRQLTAERKVMVTLQRLNSGDFFRPGKAKIVKKMMEELSSYPPSLQKLFSVQDVVREVMEFEASPDVKRAASRSAQRSDKGRRRRARSELVSDQISPIPFSDEFSTPIRRSAASTFRNPAPNTIGGHTSSAVYSCERPSNLRRATRAAIIKSRTAAHTDECRRKKFTKASSGGHHPFRRRRRRSLAAMRALEL